MTTNQEDGSTSINHITHSVTDGEFKDTLNEHYVAMRSSR